MAERVKASPLARRMADTPKEEGARLDLVGTALSALGLGLFVYGVLRSGTWGVIQPKGDAPVLLGSAKGDHSIPGIGDLPLSQIRPQDRTTPAGRFKAEVGKNLRGESVVWVDYDGGVSMHPVLTTERNEHREQRLAAAKQHRPHGQV